MLQITCCSTRCVQFDQIADYVPGLSTLTNITNLFLKCIFYFCPKSLETNHYFAHLETKSTDRCLVLLLPVIGNIILGIYDNHQKKLAKTAENKARQGANLLNAPSTPQTNRPNHPILDASSAYDDVCRLNSLWMTAAEYGSIEGQYQAGQYFAKTRQEVLAPAQAIREKVDANFQFLDESQQRKEENQQLFLNTARKYLRAAAAHGHQEANTLLGKLPS